MAAHRDRHWQWVRQWVWQWVRQWVRKWVRQWVWWHRGTQGQHHPIVPRFVKSIVLIGLCLAFLTGCQPAQPSDVVHLTFWQGVNPAPNREVLQSLIDRFEATHPKIQVESLYVGQADQQMPKILAAVVGNAAPDLLWYSSPITGQLVELNALRSLDDWWPTVPVHKEIDPTLLETMTLEGKIWSVPFDTNNVGIFYRPSLFKQAGITQLPQTWQEFRTVAKQLTRDTNGDGQIDRYGMILPLGKAEWTVFTWLPFMWSGGGELSDPNPQPSSPTPKINLLNRGAIAALQFWQDLLTDGSAILSAPERGYELEGFLSGKVAMQISGPWTLGELKKSGVDFAVMPIPRAQRSATSIGGENLFLFKSNPSREQAALTFAEYILSESFQTEWAIRTGYLPVNLKSRDRPEYKEFRAQQPVIDVFLEQAKHGRSRPLAPGYNRISDNIGRAVEAGLLQKGRPEAVLKSSQQRLDLIFQPS